MRESILTKGRIEKCMADRLGQREEVYKKLLPGLGKDTVSALRSLYELYDEKMYIWLA